VDESGRCVVEGERAGCESLTGEARGQEWRCGVPKGDFAVSPLEGGKTTLYKAEAKDDPAQSTRWAACRCD
jgi:hypothetical protein